MTGRSSHSSLRVARIVAAGLALVAGAGTLRAQTAADSASIQSFYRAWMGAAMQQGPAAYASYYATDGQVLPPNAAPVTGREAIAEWLRRSQSSAAYTLRPSGVSADEIRMLGGAWAVHRSTLRGERLPKAGGAPVPFETKYFDLLHRKADGGWEIVYRMWSDNLP